MRTTANILLLSLVVPLFLIAILAATLRFQLLSPGFWESTFEKNNVYSSLTDVVKGSIVSQTSKQGGSPSEIRFLTDLVTTANVRDFVNKNLENIFAFADTKTSQLIVYIPVSKLPKGLLPPNFASLSDTMTLSSLMTRLNIDGNLQSNIKYISLLGKTSLYLFYGDAAITVLFMILLFLLVAPGSRFVGPGIAFLLSGLISIGLYQLASQIKSQAFTLSAQKTTADLVLNIAAPPLITEIAKTWLFVGVILSVIGILLFFVKRPASQKSVTR